MNLSHARRLCCPRHERGSLADPCIRPLHLIRRSTSKVGSARPVAVAPTAQPHSGLWCSANSSTRDVSWTHRPRGASLRAKLARDSGSPDRGPAKRRWLLPRHPHRSGRVPRGPMDRPPALLGSPGGGHHRIVPGLRRWGRTRAANVMGKTEGDLQVIRPRGAPPPDRSRPMAFTPLAGCGGAAFPRQSLSERTLANSISRQERARTPRARSAE